MYDKRIDKMDVFRAADAVGTETTYTGDVVLRTMPDEMTLDHQVKKVLACRPILAYILKHTLSELRQMPLGEVEACISSTIEVGTVPVNPGVTNTVRIESQEDAVCGEGMLVYDIRTAVRISDGDGQKDIRLLINLEGQRRDKPGYDLSLRALIVYVNTDFPGRSENELINMLSDLFASDMGGRDKIRKLQSEYGINTTQEVEKEVAEMDSFATMYMERGEARGIGKGIEKGIESTVIEFILDGSVSLEKGAKKLNISEQEMKEKISQYQWKQQ